MPVDGEKGVMVFMNVLNIEHVSKIFGDKKIFDDISYGIHDGDKIGIIGINGTGKSTLLKIIAGEEETDEGQVISQNGLRITYLPQMPDFPKGAIVQDYVADGKWQKDWSTESEARNILNKLGITEHDVPVEQLSGGQKKRVALARTLVNPSDVLILDEPTNHLDNEMVTWLEDYLNRFKGVVIMVTHDRYFLDKVTNKILEISHGKVYSYDANYSGFLELKAQREEMELASERKRQSILRMELEWAKRGCRARSTKQRARLERLEALKNGKAPVQETDVQMDSVETRMGKKTVELHHISKSYGDKVILDDFDYIVLRNQRLGIIGPNGCGKSTLIRIIDGMVEPDSGTVEIGETIKIGYFAQNQAQLLDESLTVFDTIDRVAVGDIRLKIRDILGAFMFGGEASDKKVKVLSGGERTRLAMIKLLLEPVNFLILDEPTNHLDMRSKDVLKDAIREFDGTVILVSHDRDFLDGLATKVYEFGGGVVKEHLGGIYDFLQKKQIENLNELQKAPALSTSPSGGRENTDTATQSSGAKLSYEEQKELNKKLKKLERRVADCESEIEQTESAIAILEARMATPEGASDMALYEQHQKLKQQLDSVMEEWDAVSTELEEAKREQ